MHILTIIGARPQFIKAAIVSLAVQGHEGMQETLLHTGQHYDDNMSKVFFEELEIPQPTYNLGIGSAPHGAQTGQMLEKIEAIILKERPDCVLVYGDTNSTLAGALAAVKQHTLVAHVEAGLRSYNRKMPEEINRVLTDHAADLLFAPTQTAINNLHREGVPEKRTYWVGDVMYDAALHYGAKAQSKSSVIQRLDLQPKGYILATVHRAENTDDAQRLHNTFKGLMEVSQEIPVVLPLHPRTRLALKERGWLKDAAQALVLIEPVGYLDMVMLEKNAQLIATDSGGVQKEAYFHQVPCVTLRDETEWVELLDCGWNRLCPPNDAHQIAQSIRNALGKSGASCRLYGEGKASARILDILHTYERTPLA